MSNGRIFSCGVVFAYLVLGTVARLLTGETMLLNPLDAGLLGGCFLVAMFGDRKP